MIPYCKATGVGLIPWSPLARGLLTRPYSSSGSSATIRHSSDNYLKTMLLSSISAADKEIISRVDEIAGKLGVSMAVVATAWSIKKGNSPIVGLSSKSRIDDTIKALATVEKLSSKDCAYMEAAYVPKEPTGFAR